MLDMYLETMFSHVTCISLFHWFGSFVHDIAFVAFCFEFFWLFVDEVAHRWFRKLVGFRSDTNFLVLVRLPIWEACFCASL